MKLILLTSVLICYCLAAPLDDPELKSPGVLVRPAPINPDIPSDPRPEDKITPISDPEEIKKYKRQVQSAEAANEQNSDDHKDEARSDIFLPGPVQITQPDETVYGEHYAKKRETSQVTPVQQPSTLPSNHQPVPLTILDNNKNLQLSLDQQRPKRDTSTDSKDNKEQKKPVPLTLPKEPKSKRDTTKNDKETKNPIPQTLPAQQKPKRDVTNDNKEAKNPVPQTLPAQQKPKRDVTKDNKEAKNPVPQTLPAQQKPKRDLTKDNKETKNPVPQTLPAQQKPKRDTIKDNKEAKNPVPQTLPAQQKPKRDTTKDNKEAKNPVPQTLPAQQKPKRDINNNEKKNPTPETLPNKHHQTKRDVTNSEAKPDPKEIEKVETHQDHVFPARFPQKERENNKDSGSKPVIRPLSKRDIPVPTESKVNDKSNTDKTLSDKTAADKTSSDKAEGNDKTDDDDDKTDIHPATVHRPIPVSALFNNNKKTEDEKKN